MAEGVDYAHTTVNEAQLFAAGKRFAGRYFGPGSSGKLINAPERDRIFAAGLDIMCLVEGYESDAFLGRAKGREHATKALAHARALGVPDDVVFYFADDKDTDASTWPKVADYLRGCAEVVGVARVGLYGEYDSMRWAARDNVATHFFQTYAWSNVDGVPGPEWYPGNDVEQYHNGVPLAGGTVDLCRSKQDNFGQWKGSDMDTKQNARLMNLSVYQRYMREGADEVPEGALLDDAGKVVDKAKNPGLYDLRKYWKRIADEVAKNPATGGLVAHTHAGGETGPAVATEG